MASINMSDTNKVNGSPEGGDYGPLGVGNSDSSYREVTRKGSFPGGVSGVRSQGEVSGAGSMYSAVLNERPNLSNPRNRGPERAPSMIGASGVMSVTMSSRNTGRVRG